MGVEFEEEKDFNTSYNRSLSGEKTGLTDWLIKVGIAKNESSAKVIMFIVAILCFALSIFLTIKQ